jgi:tetratricopeptide (TPR) repeat protein
MRNRRDVVECQTNIGEALHRLGDHREALDALAPALETMKSLVAAAPEEISWVSTVARIHRGIGDASLAQGEEQRALEHYDHALRTTEDLIRRTPSNLYFQRYRADALESLGQYYLKLATRRPELKAQARLWLRQSLAVWQDWERRNVAAPYAGMRESKVAGVLASVD